MNLSSSKPTRSSTDNNEVVVVVLWHLAVNLSADHRQQTLLGMQLQRIVTATFTRQDTMLFLCAYTHPFDSPSSGTTQVTQYQKSNLDFTEARDSEWHQLGHMQVCTSLQRDNHASTSPLVFTAWCYASVVLAMGLCLCKSAPCSRQITMPAPHHSVFTGRMPFLLPNQQHQSTEGFCVHTNTINRDWQTNKQVTAFCHRFIIIISRVLQSL